MGCFKYTWLSRVSFILNICSFYFQGNLRRLEAQKQRKETDIWINYITGHLRVKGPRDVYFKMVLKLGTEFISMFSCS